MRVLLSFFLLAASLLVQNATYQLGAVYRGTVEYQTFSDFETTHYLFTISRAANGDKTFTFTASTCFSTLLGFPVPIALNLGCTPLNISQALDLAPIQAGLQYFYSLAPGQVAHNIDYYESLPSTANPGAKLTRKQPATASSPNNPQMLFLDGFTNNLVQLDAVTNTVLAQIALPDQPVAFAVRRALTGSENEVWTAHAGTVSEISIADFGLKKVSGTIPIPSSKPGNVVPIGIAFTNGGEIALCAVRYNTPDASGAKGAIIAFDGAKRTITSTLPLQHAPSALAIAPDALTAYLLSPDGTITYYDVFSATADLTVSTFSPGKAGGYSGGAVFIHPDGTRLFWNENAVLDVFDLTQRKVANLINSGLPTTSAASMQLSQDGAQAFMGNGAGALAIVDTRYGNVLATIQEPGATQGFGSPPAN